MIDLNKPRLTVKKYNCFYDVKYSMDINFYDRLQELENAIESGELVPVVHGKWEKNEGMYYCSACDKYSISAPYMQKFCPNCGAKMDLQEEK